MPQDPHLNGLLYSLAVLTSNVLLAARRSPDVIDWPLIERGVEGKDSLAALFEVASDLEVGRESDALDVFNLMKSLPDDPALFLVNIVEGSVFMEPVHEALAGNAENMVGVAIVSAADPKWLFWRPMGYPESDARLLELPPQASTVYSYTY